MSIRFPKRLLFLQRNYNEVFTLCDAQILYKIAIYYGTFCLHFLLQLKHLFDVRNVSVSGDITALRILTLIV